MRAEDSVDLRHHALDTKGFGKRKQMAVIDASQIHRIAARPQAQSHSGSAVLRMQSRGQHMKKGRQFQPIAAIKQEYALLTT